MTRRLHPALFALAVVLPVAAASSGDNDYELSVRWPFGNWTACAKSATVCEQARKAVGFGQWLGTPTDATATCAPKPGCFTMRSNCIPGYSGPREEGFCK